MSKRVMSFQSSPIRPGCPLKRTRGREIDTHLAQPPRHPLQEGKISLPGGPQSPKEIPVARAVNTSYYSVEPGNVASTGGQRDSHDFRISLPGVIGLHPAWRAVLFLTSRKLVFHRQRSRTCRPSTESSGAPRRESAGESQPPNWRLAAGSFKQRSIRCLSSLSVVGVGLY
jgi:hypothetical protein